MELERANKSVGYSGDSSLVASGISGVWKPDGPGYNYAYVWRVGSISAGDTPESKMSIMQRDPNAIFPFTVVPMDPNTGKPWGPDSVGAPPMGLSEIHLGNSYDLQGATNESVLLPKGHGFGHDPVSVVEATPTSFMFRTLQGHFDGPDSYIRFSTFAKGADVLFMQRGYAPNVNNAKGTAATGITSIWSWRTQARNLAGYPNGPTSPFSVDP